MESDILFEDMDETNAEQGSLFIWESLSVNTDIESINEKLDQSAIDKGGNSQHCVEISPYLKGVDEDKKPESLFAPFSHQMKPDPEYLRLLSERSATNQEHATKLINERCKWIMENAVIRKEKEQKLREYVMKPTQLSNIIGSREVVKTTQLSPTAFEDIQKITLLVHNMHITSDFVIKSRPEEFSDYHHEFGYWDSNLNRFIQLNFGELNTKTNISCFDILKTKIQHHEHKVEGVLSHIENKQKDKEQKMNFTQLSQNLASTKVSTEALCDGHEAFGFLYEDDLDKGYEN